MGKQFSTSDKSHVSMEMNKCAICTKDFETGSLILDKRLKQSLDRYTVTGWGTCPDCQKILDQGTIALVVVDRDKSVFLPNGNLGLDGAYRTGEIMFVKRSSPMFIPKAPDIPMMFINEVDATNIKNMAASAGEGE